MKLLAMGFLALAIGVAGGAYFSGAKVADELLAAAADSAATAHDPVPAGGASGAAGTVTAQPGGEPAHGPDSEVAAAAHEPAAATGGDATPVAPTGPTEQELAAEAARVAAVQAAADSARNAEEGARKLSKIFGAMQAQDAAAVLQEMEDGEIELILRNMSDRLAAQILGVFEPARAAALSRAVLGTSEP